MLNKYLGALRNKLMSFVGASTVHNPTAIKTISMTLHTRGTEGFTLYTEGTSPMILHTRGTEDMTLYTADSETEFTLKVK